MENRKIKGLFTALFTLTIFLTLGNVFAATEYVPVYLTVKDANGTTLKTDNTYTNIKAGDKIYVTAHCDHEKALYWSQNSLWMDKKGYKVNDKGMALLGYGFDISSASEFISSSDPTELVITIPNYAEGSTHTLKIQAVGAIDYLQEGDILYEAFAGFKIDIKIPNVETTISESITKVNDTTLKVTATVTNGTFSKIVYNWDGGANQESTNNPLNITIPNFSPNSLHTLTATASTTNGKTVTQKYSITMPAALTGDFNVSYNGGVLANNSVTKVPVGSNVVVTGNPAQNFKSFSGSWKVGTNTLTEISFSGTNYSLNIPGSEGQTVVLTLTGQLTDGGKTNTKTYQFQIPSSQTVLIGSIDVKLDGKELANNSTTLVNGDEELELIGTPNNNFSSLRYSWDDGEEHIIPGSTGKIKVLAEERKTHTLKVYGILNDNTKITIKTFKFEVETDEELIIEPWMRENKDAEGLLVSLRNDSEEEKANKNFYQLDEEVIYYIDYKNCGKDIDNEVKLVLKVPINFDVVKSDGGTVSKAAKTITWIFKNGLEEEQSGTKEVVVKYRSLSKSSYDYELVYPEAEIYKTTKKMDSSAVINYIYISASEKIEEEHEPYMFGDSGKTTFRPDSTITRAEGALVLTRIFGINTSNVKITDRYSDIQETYLEAQKAITAASNLGIINGYENGMFKPNEKMTRAEFMKIIASYIELLGEEEKISGLKIKDTDTIKVYKNNSNRSHWAISYVTFLTRINMTPVSNTTKDLRLDDEITRAEVAQLVNFCTFRAPAKVTTATKTKFSDVSRNHKLFSDIVEATRDSHTFTITVDGREKVK